MIDLLDNWVFIVLKTYCTWGVMTTNHIGNYKVQNYRYVACYNIMRLYMLRALQQLQSDYLGQSFERVKVRFFFFLHCACVNVYLTSDSSK